MRLGPLTQNQAPKYRDNEASVLIGLSVSELRVAKQAAKRIVAYREHSKQRLETSKREGRAGGILMQYKEQTGGDVISSSGIPDHRWCYVASAAIYLAGRTE